MKWRFAENDTDVSEGLTPWGTSQGDDGLLRIFPVNVLSPNGTVFQCVDTESNERLNVTLVLCKF